MGNPRSASVILEIPFHDVDSIGFVWHGHYVKYFEIARTQLMRQMGLDIPQMAATGCVWPVVECQIKYIRPLRYGQKIKVEAALTEYENRLKTLYVITNPDTGERLTKGSTTQLAVDAVTGELVFESPREILECIAKAQG